MDFRKRGAVVLYMLEHFSQDDCVEARVRERKLSEIGSNDGSSYTPSQVGECGIGDVRARDRESSTFEQGAEATQAGAAVQDGSSSTQGEKLLQKQPLPKLVPRPHELGRRTPHVLGDRRHPASFALEIREVTAPTARRP